MAAAGRRWAVGGADAGVFPPASRPAEPNGPRCGRQARTSRRYWPSSQRPGAMSSRASAGPQDPGG